MSIPTISLLPEVHLWRSLVGFLIATVHLEHLGVYKCVCVCAHTCMTERGREGERERESE